MRLLNITFIILGVIIFYCCQTAENENSIGKDKINESSQNQIESKQDTNLVSYPKEMEKGVLSNIEVGTNPEKTMTHNEALAYCESLGDGWRMPNREEMQAIYEIKDSIGFFGYYFWTSELASEGKAWYQYMGKDGKQLETPIDTEKFVWPIRDK